MSKETIITHWCDYSSQVARHVAHYHIRFSDDELDSCAAHLLQVVRSYLVTTSDDQPEISIHLIAGTERQVARQLVEPRAKAGRKPGSGPRVICPACMEQIHPRSKKRHFQDHHPGQSVPNFSQWVPVES